MQEIPVYLFTGFLEAGKTKFIQETLEDPRFDTKEQTLFLMCEEGIEELNPKKFACDNVYVEYIEDKEEINSANLNTLAQKYNATRIVIEYNGMWELGLLYSELPENWMVYQELMFADSNTILSYNQNMRQLVVDKLQSCELVIFNRRKPKSDIMQLHKLVRGITRRANIIYEDTNGEIENDNIVDPLPFDINAEIIEIEDKDFAIWYRDLAEETNKYNGKKVKFKGIIAIDEQLPSNIFVAGRHIMTCCADDIAYRGIACKGGKTKNLKSRDWLTITGKIVIEHCTIYEGNGPVIKIETIEKATKPEEEVCTFY